MRPKTGIRQLLAYSVFELALKHLFSGRCCGNKHSSVSSPTPFREAAAQKNSRVDSGAVEEDAA